MVRIEPAAEFSRLHKVFVFHLGVATALAWCTAAYAGLHAPWVRNLAFLIDPASTTGESTFTYLFTFPILLTAAWISAFAGRQILFQIRLLRSQAMEFAFAGAVMFVLFYASIDRAVTALRLAWI